MGYHEYGRDYLELVVGVEYTRPEDMMTDVKRQNEYKREHG